MRRLVFTAQWASLVLLLSATLLGYIWLQNCITQTRIELRGERRVVQALQESNTELRYEVACLESPQYLLELLARAEFSHLKHPTEERIFAMQDENHSNSAAQVPNVSWAPKVILGSR